MWTLPPDQHTSTCDATHNSVTAIETAIKNRLLKWINTHSSRISAMSNWIYYHNLV